MTANDSALPLCGVKQLKVKHILMMKKLQKLINRWEKEAAFQLWLSETTKNKEKKIASFSCHQRLRHCIDGLALLLNAETQTTVKKPEA